MLILIVGVPGVGKSSVIKEAIKYLNREIKVVNFGDVLLEIVKEKYKITDRDEIRKKLKREEYEEVQIETCKKIKEIEEKEKIIILDTHFIIETEFGYKSGLYKKMAEILKPNYIIVITANPKEILERRIRDKSRKRDIEDIKRIELQQNLTIYYSLIFMYENDSEVIFIENPEGRLEETGKTLANILDRILPER